MYELNLSLQPICHSVNFIRNSRLELAFPSENEQQVRTLLKAAKYVITDRNECKGLVEFRCE